MQRGNPLLQFCFFVFTVSFFIGCQQMWHLDRRYAESSGGLWHTVEARGETLAKISSWYTGKSTNWPLIAKANKGLNPNVIYLGQKIYIPGSLIQNATPYRRGNSYKPTTSGRSSSGRSSSPKPLPNGIDPSAPKMGESAPGRKQKPPRNIEAPFTTPTPPKRPIENPFLE